MSDLLRGQRLVVIVTSAGGLQALDAALAPLPEGFPAPIVALQHLHPDNVSHLAEILDRKLRLRVRQAYSGCVVQAGDVYVAPPGHHLLIDAFGRLSLSTTGKVRFARPSADVLLASAAASYTHGVVAVVLTGAGSDGAAGVSVVHALGGIVIVQSPISSRTRGMPTAAIQTGVADHVLPLEQIGACLLRLLMPSPTAAT